MGPDKGDKSKECCKCVGGKIEWERTENALGIVRKIAQAQDSWLEERQKVKMEGPLPSYPLTSPPPSLNISRENKERQTKGDSYPLLFSSQAIWKPAEQP